MCRAMGEGGIMFCTRCGAELPDGARFCTCCGTEVEQLGFEPGPEASAVPVADVCPVCGASVEADQAFCTSCGAPLSAVAPEPANDLPDGPESFGDGAAALFTQPVVPAWAEAEVAGTAESMLEADSASKASFAEPEPTSESDADAESSPAAGDAFTPAPEPECEPVPALAPEAAFASIPGQEPDFDGEPERSPEAEVDHQMPQPQPVVSSEQEEPSAASDVSGTACADELAPSAPEAGRAVESAPFAPESPAPEAPLPTTVMPSTQAAPDATASATGARIEPPLPAGRCTRSSALSASPAAVRRRRAAEREPRRRGIGRTVASVAVVAVVLIIAAAIGSTGGFARIASLFGGRAVTASYLDDTPIAVDGATRIVPLRGEDDPLEGYIVRPKQADSAADEPIDIVDVPRLEVTGSDGFAIGDFGTLAAGTYLFTVVDGDGVERDLPPVVVGRTDEANAAGRITVEPAPGVTDPDALSVSGKYRCFRDKLQGLIDSFGDASLTVLKADDDRYLAWTAGVSYAELVDFGDGVERLVVAYCTDRDLASADAVEASAGDGDVGPTVQSYRVEVWEYDEEADAASLVCQTRPATTDDGWPFIEYVSDPETGATCLYVGGTDVNGSRARSCFGVSDSGNFAELPAQGVDTWPRVSRYLMESSGLTQEAAVDAAPSGEFSCTETAQTVKDLTARLNTILS